jgi:uncharacterized Zn finger protein
VTGPRQDRPGEVTAGRPPWPAPARPIRVDGGIKARSRRGAIGAQWWSRRFIGVLESYGMSGRLARGRAYARAGQVLDFALAQGKVTAQVQGSRVRPYQVRIGVLPLTAAQWRRVESQLSGQALFRAKLLAGEMPPEIEEVFAECGTPLFPRLASDLDMRCSCPDWEVPCKHLAAVCYVLAEEFDREPFALLAWRGQGRDELLAALRQVRPGGSGPAPDPPAAGEPPAAPAAPAAPLAALFTIATSDSATSPPSISRPPPSAVPATSSPPSSVARPPWMVRPWKTTERPELPTTSKTRLVDPASMTELDSPCPTIVNVLLLRPVPSMSNWPPVTA